MPASYSTLFYSSNNWSRLRNPMPYFFTLIFFAEPPPPISYFKQSSHLIPLNASNHLFLSLSPTFHFLFFFSSSSLAANAYLIDLTIWSSLAHRHGNDAAQTKFELTSNSPMAMISSYSSSLHHASSVGVDWNEFSPLRRFDCNH